jgi:NADH:ubiquinone oxidoreductase subunit
MLAEVYGVAIADLANQGPPEEFEEWIGIPFKNANGEVHNIAIKQTGGIFLPLIYARTVSHLASRGSVDEFQEWIDVLLDRAKKSAINNPHGEEPVLFLGQVYTIAISYVARRGPPEEFDGWVEMLVKRAEVALDETHSDEETQWFLHWFYGNTLAQLPLQKVSAKNDWAELLLNKAVAVAAHKPDDSAKFIELVYSVAIAIISDAANPEVAEFMPSEFAEKVSYEGLGEYVELLFKFAGGISIDGFRADEKFQARVLAISVIHTSPSNPLRQGGHSQFLSNRVESGYDADSLAEFYRSFLSVVIKGVLEKNDISPDWLSWLIHDARKRSIEVTSKDRHTRESAELLGVVAGAIASAIQAGLPKGLDSDPGREVVSAAASVSEENIELIDSVVTAATNEIHGEFDTEVDYSRSSGGEDETVREFTAQVYAAAVGFHGQAAVANDDAVSTLYQNALSRGEVFEDQSAYLREFHLDALIRLSEGADSTDSPVWHNRMFDRAYSETNMSLADLASAYLTQLAESDDHETGWLAWVIVEATERVATDAGDETLLINLAADAVDAIWQEEVDLRQSTEFDRVVSAVNRLETFNDISRIEVIKGVKKRLEDEHLNEIAALDWKQAFD